MANDRMANRNAVRMLDRTPPGVIVQAARSLTPRGRNPARGYPMPASASLNEFVLTQTEELVKMWRDRFEAGVGIVVLDRPNPLGGERAEGPVLEGGFESFVGAHRIPIRYGLTAGELARTSERGSVMRR